MAGGLVRGYKKHLTVPHPGWQRTDPLDRGLVAEWRFDPATGLVLPDYSGYGYHGTVVGADWISTEYGPALNFVDANVDYVNTNHQRFGGTGLFCDASETFTFEMFAKVPVDPNGYLIGKHSGANGHTFGFNITEAATRSPRIYLRNLSTSTSAGIDDDQWHLHTVTWDGSTARYYLDEDFFMNLNVGANAESAVPLIIGAQNNVGLNPIDATVASVRIQDRALAAAEVSERYEICLKRAQAMTHVWMIPQGMVTVIPRIPRHPAAYNTLAIY